MLGFIILLTMFHTVCIMRFHIFCYSLIYSLSILRLINCLNCAALWWEQSAFETCHINKTYFATYLILNFKKYGVVERQICFKIDSAHSFAQATPCHQRSGR